jgi:hypothetical protein
MNRTRSILSAALAMGISLGAAIVINTPAVAHAQEVVVAFAAPPPAFIATATPEYFGGRACYFFNGAWHYRDGDHWNYYRSEPPFLRERRSHWGEARGHEADHGRYHYRR